MLLSLYQPAGILGAVLALGIWIPAFFIKGGYLLGNKVFTGYPAVLHSEQIFALFVLPLLTFFILRAPTFSGDRESPEAKGGVPMYLLIGQALMIPLSFAPERMPFHLVFAACALGLFAFAYNQAKTRANMGAVDVTALLLGTALFLQAAATLLLLFTPSAAQGGGLHRLGRLILFYGVMPPALAGLGMSVRATPEDKGDKIRAYVLLAVFAGTFVWDLIALLLFRDRPSLAGELLRLLTFAFLLPRFFPLRAWASRGARGFLVLGALLLTLAGLGGHLFDSVHGVHLAHLYFVGGIGLLLVMSGDGFAWARGEETFRRAGWTIAVLFIVAALTRATAHFWPRIFYSHLLYAAVLQMAALAAWLFVLLKRRDSGETRSPV